MTSRSVALAALVAANGFAISADPTAVPFAFAPSTKAAADRGSQIFNAVFDSLRQYGTTVHPNGMSLFLASVPQGVLFHHGNNRNATPTTLDWLAYEIEHAEMFARPRTGRRPPPGGLPPLFDGAPAQAAFGGDHDYDENDADDDDNDDNDDNDLRETTTDTGHGWLHTYRTTRPLQFLYIDGMSGDKGSDGVIDTQDYLLRADKPNKRPDEFPLPTRPPGPPGEFARATDLCDLCAAWGLQGVIRTEGAGTEIIKCDFFDGLEEVQAVKRPIAGGSPGGPRGPGGGPRGPGGGGSPGGGPPGGGPGGPHGPPPHMPLEPFNVEHGFRDVGAHRTVLDYASMVSAFFFPVNLTNPDADRAAYPRLVSVSTDELVAMKAYLARVVAARRRDVSSFSSYSWRDVADLVVRRYQPRLVALANANTTANATAADSFPSQLQAALDVFTDYSVNDDDAQRDREARARCTGFYLQTKLPLATDTESETSPSTDELLYAAFAAVTGRICNVLYDALGAVVADQQPASVVAARQSVRQLIAYLDWSVFEVAR